MLRVKIKKFSLSINYVLFWQNEYMTPLSLSKADC